MSNTNEQNRIALDPIGILFMFADFFRNCAENDETVFGTETVSTIANLLEGVAVELSEHVDFSDDDDEGAE